VAEIARITIVPYLRDGGRHARHRHLASARALDTNPGNVPRTLATLEPIDPGVVWIPGFTVFTFIDYGAVSNSSKAADDTFAALGSAGAGFP